MKERLLLLYKLNKIDKELQELFSLKGDIPSMIEELKNQRTVLEEEISTMQEQLDEIINTEQNIETENDSLSERIDKDDNILRSGAVKSNEEYNALVREIEDAYEKIESNEKLIDSDYKGRQTALETKLTDLKTKFEEINSTLNQKQEELTELGRQTEEEEKELTGQRNEMMTHINAEDMEYYERVSNAKFGDAVAIVRKGSCLGCFSSIPPQRAIEIRMADRFFTCEACGRILIAEELINE